MYSYLHLRYRKYLSSEKVYLCHFAVNCLYNSWPQTIICFLELWISFVYSTISWNKKEQNNIFSYVWFHVLIDHLYILFCECLFKFFAHFLMEWIVFLLSCKSSLNNFDTNPLSNICIANIFPQFVSCLFILLLLLQRIEL